MTAAMDYRMEDVFVEEPGARVQVKQRDEDAVSIKEGGDQNIKLNIIGQNAAAREDNNYCEESSLNVTMAALDTIAATIGACEEKEEFMNEDSVKGPCSRGLTCAVATSRDQSGSSDEENATAM